MATHRHGRLSMMMSGFGCLAKNLDVEFSLAARLVTRLRGAASRIGKGMKDSELMPDTSPWDAGPLATAPSAAAARAAAAHDIPVDAEGDLTLDPQPPAAEPQPTTAVYATVPDVTETPEQRRIRLTAGVTRLMHKLEVLRPSAPMQKGITTQEFTKSFKYYRRLGERVTDFLARWDEGVQLLETAGVDLSGVPDLLGFYFYQMLNLNQERRERMLAAMPSEHFDLGRFRRPWQARPRTVFETGLDAPWADVEDSQSEPDQSGQDDDEGLDPSDFQAAVSGELEAFMTDLQDQGGNLDEIMGPEHAAQVESAASTLAEASEAFTIMRDAPRPSRPQMSTAALRASTDARKARPTCKDCGLMGHWAGDAPCKGMTRGTFVTVTEWQVPDHDAMMVEAIGPAVLAEYQVQLLRQVLRAWLLSCDGADSDSDSEMPELVDSDESGDEISAQGYQDFFAQFHHLRVGTDEILDDFDSDEDLLQDFLPVLVYETDSDGGSTFAVSEQPSSDCDSDYSIGSLYDGTEVPFGLEEGGSEHDVDLSVNAGRGIIDTACALSVAGDAWWNSYKADLAAYNLLKHAHEQPSVEPFRFGDGGILTAQLAVVAPAVIANTPLEVFFCVVPSQTLGLLLGRAFLTKHDAAINLQRREISIANRKQALEDSFGGHFCVPLRPEAYTPQRLQPRHRTVLPESVLEAEVLTTRGVQCEDDASTMPQNQEWRPLKRGQQMQLSAGRRRAEVMARHRVQPQPIQTQMELQASRDVASVLRQAVHRSGVRVALQQTLCLCVHGAFEWPRACLGWKQYEVQQLCHLLPGVCQFDGCRFAAQDSRGRPFKSPWHVQTDHPGLLQALDVLCKRQHLHGSADAAAAGRYTDALVKRIVTAVTLPAQAVRQVEEAEDEPMTDDEREGDLQGMDIEEEEFTQQQNPVLARTGGPKPVPHPMPIEDETIVRAAVKQLHTNLGRPENRSLARAIRLTGGSHLAIKTALDFQCPVCKRIAEPKPIPSRSLRRWQNFGDCIAVDLFSLADCHGQSLTFLNAIDMASRYQVVTFVPSKLPLVIYKAFKKTWVTPFGVPKAVLTDLGGEFNREFSQELSDLGSQMLTSAAISPTQNAVAERAGGLWKLHARAVLDESSIDYHQTDRLDWLCATVSWARNARVDETGYSPSQWVLGCGIRLPYRLRGCNLALQSRMEQDHTFADRVAMQSAAQRSAVGLHYSRALSRAFLARARTSQPAAASFAVGDQVYYWRGIVKRGARRLSVQLGIYATLSLKSFCLGKQPQPPAATADGAAVPEEEMGGGEVPPSGPPPADVPPSGPPPADFDFEPRAEEGDLYDTPLGQEEEMPQGQEEEIGQEEEQMSQEEEAMSREEEMPPFQPGAGDSILRRPPESLERPAKLHRTAIAQLQEFEVTTNCGSPRLTLLTGPARAKELRWDQLSPAEQVDMQKAMDAEWDKWTGFKATRNCSVAQLQAYRLKHPGLKIIGARWVLVRKSAGKLKARLVVQGCQELASSLRRDAPTASPVVFHLVTMLAAQTGWIVSFHDAASAYLQSEPLSRLLLLRMPAAHPPRGTSPNEVRVALGAIYGTRDAPRAWYLHLRGVLSQHGIQEAGLEKDLYVLPGANGPLMIISTHVDDLAVARCSSDLQTAEILAALTKELHLREKVLPATYCGKRVEILPHSIRISQPKAVASLELVQLDSSRKHDADSLLQPSEQILYRSVVGQLLWLATQTRPDLGFAVSHAAQRFSAAKVSDLLQLNSLIKQAQLHSSVCLTFRRGLLDLSRATVLAYGDSAFANAEGLKSQYGVVVVVTTDAERYVTGQYQLGTVWAWSSATVKSVVRSTLAAGAYGISEAAEHGHLLRQLLQQ
ncbi:unnamed protein product, partial [Polarella glacialis]